MRRTTIWVGKKKGEASKATPPGDKKTTTLGSSGIVGTSLLPTPQMTSFVIGGDGGGVQPPRKDRTLMKNCGESPKLNLGGEE